jgi:hypothetical protein
LRNNLQQSVDVVDSLRYYYMLSIYLISKDIPEYEVTQSLKEFIKEGIGTWHDKGNKNLAKYSELAYNSLPAEFLSFMQISTKGDSDQISFKKV